MKKKLILCALLLLIPVAVPAFDGKRKGFVLGGGIGYAPFAQWSVGDQTENWSNAAVQVLVGYGLDEQNLLVLHGDAVMYPWEYPPETIVLWGDRHQTGSQEFLGIVWYHYFRPRAVSLFSAAGMGLCDFDGDGDYDNQGPGYILGGGLAFSRRFQAGLYFSGGRTGVLGSDTARGHNHLVMVITTVGY